MSNPATREVDLEILEFDGVREMEFRPTSLYFSFCPAADVMTINSGE